MRRGGRASRRIETEAVVVRIVEYGESDVIATLFTEAEGKVSAMVRGARKGSRRLGGAIEPFHTIAASLDEQGGELVAVREARLVRVRAGLGRRLEALEAAGKALRWVRTACPPRTPEPLVWEALRELLDALDEGAPEGPALATFGLRMLGGVGYGLDLERCVRCGKTCPADRPAAIDAGRGGLVCQSCGGARRVLSPAVRARAIAAQGGSGGALTDADAVEFLSIVEDVLAAHAGVEP
jgi:DNA repair protein RecO (recombination protein O)